MVPGASVRSPGSSCISSHRNSSPGIKFAILTFKLQLSSIKYIHLVVQPPPPSICRTSSSSKTEARYPLSTNSPQSRETTFAPVPLGGRRAAKAWSCWFPSGETEAGPARGFSSSGSLRRAPGGPGGGLRRALRAQAARLWPEWLPGWQRGSSGHSPDRSH